MTRIYAVLLALAVALLFLPAAFAGGPGKGSLLKTRQVTVATGDACLMDITVEWNLDALMGEPIIWGRYKYSPQPRSLEACSGKLANPVTVWLRLADRRDSGSYGFVEIDLPLPPKGPNQWSWDPTPYSTAWDQVVCGYQGHEPFGCLSKREAISIWKNGKVVDFVIVTGR